MVALNLKISEKLDRNLSYYAKEQHKAKSYLARRALEAYMMQLQEDEEDYRSAMEALQDPSPPIPWEEIKKKYGLED